MKLLHLVTVQKVPLIHYCHEHNARKARSATKPYLDLPQHMVVGRR